MVGTQFEGGLSLVVQVQCIYSHTVLHAVVHSSYAATYANVVYLLARIVIVIRIALCHLHLYVVLTFQAEYRMAEAVESLRSIRRVLICQLHLHLVAFQVGCGVGLVAEVVK